MLTMFKMLIYDFLTDLGQRNGPTNLDIARLKTAYSCQVCEADNRGYY